MPANSQRITATLTAGQAPPDSIIGRRNSPHIVPMVTLSKAMLLKELRDIDTILAAAYLWLAGAMDTFTCENKIVLAQARIESLRKAITGADPALHDALCEKAPTHTGPRGISHEG